MSLLPSTSTNPLFQEIQNFTNSINFEYNRLVKLLNTGSTLVWNNDQGFTPQQVVSTMGQAGGSIFQLSSLLCGLLGAITSVTPNPVPVGWGVTINADNTVTLTPPSTST
jgi:hypothetical protein